MLGEAQSLAAMAAGSSLDTPKAFGTVSMSDATRQILAFEFLADILVSHSMPRVKQSRGDARQAMQTKGVSRRDACSWWQKKLAIGEGEAH